MDQEEIGGGRYYPVGRIPIHGNWTKAELFDLARAIFWAALLVPAYTLGWLNSVAFVSLLSLWALTETAWAAFRGGTEKRLREIEDKIDLILERL